MKERPILFKSDMVRAILDGRKTQTRRAVKEQPMPDVTEATHDHSKVNWYWWDYSLQKPAFKCPYGIPGDRLWVRETFAHYSSPQRRKGVGKPDSDWRLEVGYKVDYKGSGKPPYGWKSPIHMPRWASRITLEITDVRVERVQEISEKDAEKEGISKCDTHFTCDQMGFCPNCLNKMPKKNHNYEVKKCIARLGFVMLWNSIHGKDAWERNEWVWVISFKPECMKEPS